MWWSLRSTNSSLKFLLNFKRNLRDFEWNRDLNWESGWTSRNLQTVTAMNTHRQGHTIFDLCANKKNRPGQIFVAAWFLKSIVFWDLSNLRDFLKICHRPEIASTDSRGGIQVVHGVHIDDLGPIPGSLGHCAVHFGPISQISQILSNLRDFSEIDLEIQV